MRERLWVFIAAGLTLSGCGLFPEGRGPEAAAERRMRIADSLEQEGLFHGAATEYATVAEEFPQSSYYPSAVRRAALMYSISPYSARNDSSAYRWYIAYLSLPMKKPERENVRVTVEFLHRILLLHAQIAQIYTASDSLSVLAKRQSASLNADLHRLQELELELQNAQAELRKIKEIDLRLSKSRVR
jgi:hypothetical protein